MLLAPQIFEQRGRFSRWAPDHHKGHHSRREGRPDPLHHPNAQLQRADRLSPITGDVQGAGDLKLPRQSAVLLWKLMLSPVDLPVDLDLRRFLVVAGQTCRDQGRLEGRHLSMEITLELLEVLEFVASGNGAKDALGNEPLERLEGWTGKRIGALILSLHGRPPHFFPPKKILRGLVSEDPRIPGGSARFKPLFPPKMAICHKRTGSDNLTPLKSRSNRCTPKSLSSKSALVLRGGPDSLKRELLVSVRRALNSIAPGCPLGDTGISAKQRVSLTMIVRNEEKNIADCLESVRELVDELVVVDTGSQDRTKVIASALGAKVFDFPWVDSFARARNEAILHATGDWIFWLDADDRLDRENREKLKKVFQTLPRKRLLAYSMKVECVAQPGGSATV